MQVYSKSFNLGVLYLTFGLDLLSEFLETIDGLLILLFFVLKFLRQFGDFALLVLYTDHLTIDSGLEVAFVSLVILLRHRFLLDEGLGFSESCDLGLIDGLVRSCDVRLIINDRSLVWIGLCWWLWLSITFSGSLLLLWSLLIWRALKLLLFLLCWQRSYRFGFLDLRWVESRSELWPCSATSTTSSSVEVWVDWSLHQGICT